MAPRSRPARIAFFDAYAQTEGAGLALLDLLAHIDRRRFEPIILLPRPGALAGAAAEAGLPVRTIEPPPPLDAYGHRLPSAGVGEKLRAGVALARYSRTIARRLRADSIDLLHCNQTRAAVTAGPGGRLARLPVVWNVRIHERLPRSLVRVADVCSDLIIPLTDRDFAGLPDEQRLLRKSTVIRNAIDTQRFSPAGRGIALRSAPGVAQDAPVILSAGVLVRRKGFDVLLRAMGRVLVHLPEARLLIAGGEPAGHPGCRAELEALVRDLGIAPNVVLLGRREDMPDLLRACDLFALPSRHEGDPAVVLEAMATARPVVVSSPAAAAVDHGETGLVVPTGDEGALAEALIALLRRSERARRMGAEGRRVVVQRHDIRAMARRYEAAWAGLLR
ncbi:MAG: glycosyltransferase family 4 protein [Armatimonadota bacterium]|jgi:glycosyltransferase involved in cell wall biosynthesis